MLRTLQLTKKRTFLFQMAEMLKLIKQELFHLLEQKIQDPLLNLQHHPNGKKIISVILDLINS